jgi:HK97 family phage prohead protease
MPVDVSVERYMPLDDIQVRSDGDGRTVDAYAAVFGVRQEIRDREGHYLEELAPTAFDRTLAQRADRLQYIFNHGRTMHGTPSERFSMPIGTPVEVVADTRGVRTTSRIAKTDLGDEVLELIRDGAIRGQSFGGAFTTTETAGRDESSGLAVKLRTEVALREYGPTPFPAYEQARIVGVRSEALEIIEQLSVDEIVSLLAPLSVDARSELVAALTDSALADTRTGTVDPAAPRTVAGLSIPQRQKALRSLDISRKAT